MFELLGYKTSFHNNAYVCRFCQSHGHSSSKFPTTIQSFDINSSIISSIPDHLEVHELYQDYGIKHSFFWKEFLDAHVSTAHHPI